MTTPAKPKTRAEFEALLKSRHNAELLAATMRRAKEVEEINARPIDAGNPYELLSQEELRELDMLSKREAAQKAEFNNNLRSFGQWSITHPEVPASPEAAAKLVEFCKQRGQSLNFGNLDRAWRSLQESETLRPDFSNRNRQQHENNLEILRSVGIRIDTPPDASTASPEDIKAFYAQQPSDNLQVLTDESSSTGFDF